MVRMTDTLQPIKYRKTNIYVIVYRGKDTIFVREKVNLKMENNISAEEREYASKIAEMRYAGELKRAVHLCDEAITAYENNNFFYKIKGDILYAMREYEKAMDIYMEYLGKIKKTPEFFTNFSRFVEKICRVHELDKKIFEELLRISRNVEYANVIRMGVLRIIYDY